MERYRITADTTLYYCTFSVVDWLPVFVSEAAFRTVTDSLHFCHAQKLLGIDCFVIMPTHLHLIVFDREFSSERLSKTLTEFRRFTGHELVKLCRAAMPACYTAAFAAAAGEDREHRFWQTSRHPETINSERFHNQKRDYLQDNPRRKGLVLDPTHWRWSSARWYATQTPCDVPITPVEW